MLFYIIILCLLYLLYNNNNNNNNNNNFNINLNNDLKNIQKNFNKNKKKITFTKNKIIIPTIEKKKDNIKNLFNNIFKYSKLSIKYINIETCNIYTVDNNKFYDIIYNTNYGYIQIKLISQINKIINIFNYNPDEINYLQDITLINNYRPIRTFDYKLYIRQHQKQLEKASKMKVYIQNKLW
tara:strand:- start:327 stop:872 length:546 start_codon:yes stop_codon:yes gene_type:complete